METKKLTSTIDDIYFRELAGKDPRDVCGSAPCRYDDERKCYVISAWGDEYAIFPHERKIILIDNTAHNPDSLFYLFLIYYLLKSTEIKAAGEWISEKDFPGGPTFFRGPHEVPTHLICQRFANDTEAFRRRCLALYGTPLDMGDVAYRFDIVPGISTAVLYWAGDDEFPPEVKLLYDKGISGQLPLDIVFSLAVAICERIGRV